MNTNNEETLWTEDNECVTLRSDFAKGCVFIQCSDGFHLCGEKSLADFCEGVRRGFSNIKANNELLYHI